ncbi:MAG: DUF3352 domain-containing protein [Candidatus Limnocylindrales bacterium]
MTEPRTPEDRPIDSGTTTSSMGAAPIPAADQGDPTHHADPAESPTQAWPSLTERSISATPPSVASSAALPPLAATVAEAPVAAAPVSGSPFEPAESTPVGTVGEPGTPGPSGAPRGRSKLRWALALVGVLIVAAGSFLIVSLVGGRPSTSSAMGYMTATTYSYNEVRLDLPGDQRQKLASFLQAFPGFADQSAIEPKIDEVFDRIVRAASKDQQTWTADIKPWFGGAIAVGAGLPDAKNTSAMGMTGADGSLVAVTITDRAKAIAWLTKTAASSALVRATYGDADLFSGPVPAGVGSEGRWAVAINDKVMLAGNDVAVKAAVDSAGKGTFAQNDDVKAALATLEKDYVMFGVTRTRVYAEAAVKLFATSQPGVLEKSQIDETVLALVPAWQATTARFENDAIVVSTAGPSWTIGYETANRASEVVGHVPAKTVLYVDLHDVGPNLTAILAKFRGLDEAKSTFAQLDQALSLLGGSDAVYGWWGDSALVVSPLADGTIGGGLVIHPKDAEKAKRLFTTLDGFLALAGGSSGISTRSEDHNGTKVTIIDLSGMAGMSADLPPGYKPEFAWASNADVAVLGYGSAFVKAVLDAGSGASLGDDARFKGLLGRVGAENMGVSFLDIAAIRSLLEPLAQGQVPADEWTRYTTDIQPYLKPLDALISVVRKDAGLDRGSGILTAH